MEQMPGQEKDREVIKTLRQYLSEGMLLHGSKVLVDQLEPRQASDDDVHRSAGKSFAIYAEASDIRIPILMALFDKADTSQADWRTSYSGHGPDEPIMVGGKNYTFTPGYIYVLPANHFKIEGDNNDREYIATEPVKPVQVIPINPSILSLFDDIEFDQNNI